MNLLFDQTGAQATFYNGAAEYAQSVFLNMLSMLKNYPDTKIFTLYSSARKFRYEALSPDALKDQEHVTFVDYHNKTVKEIIKENNIDLLFITCAQSFCDLAVGDLGDLGCKVVVVIHDLYVEEMENSKIEYPHYIKHPWRFIHNSLGRVKVRLLSGTTTSRHKIMRGLIENNDSIIITVSDYTKNSIEYFFPDYSDRIFVFYSPMKVCPFQKEEIDNARLREIVREKKKYFLLLSADRVTKNGERMLNAFKRYVKNCDSSALVVTTGYKKDMFKGHIALPFLSSSDIEHLYQNCHALLYPSLFEGFGYPPIEVMRFDKPVLSSNVCSMPEILGDAPIYFSPVYESSMYGALRKFNSSSYEKLQEQVHKQYEKVHRRQNDDLKKLSTILLNGSLLK